MLSDEVEPHLQKMFELIKKVGSGAYGHVWKVQDKKTKEIFALKKIFDAFQHSTDAQRTYREVMFLQELDHPNIVRLHSVFKAENEKDVYLLFQFMEADLHQAIRENILYEIHKRYIVHQLLKSLKYIHSGGLIHRDLKPSNVLLNESCLVKICDFGLVRSLSYQADDDPVMTDHVATRWYRAPEILLGSRSYDKAVDVWSLGCIVAELYCGGKPLFPGSSTLNQLQRILQFTGKPSAEDIDAMRSEVAENMLSSIKTSKQKSAAQFFPNAPADAVQIITQMLTFNPSKRPSVDKLLNSPFVQKFKEKSEKVCTNPIIIPVSDSTKLGLKEYRALIYELSGKNLRDKKKSNFIEPKKKEPVERPIKEQSEFQRLEKERQERKRERERQMEQNIMKQQQLYKNQLAQLQRKKQLLKDRSAKNFREVDKDLKNKSVKDHRYEGEKSSSFFEEKDEFSYTGAKRQNKSTAGVKSTYEKFMHTAYIGSGNDNRGLASGYSAKSQTLLKQLYSPLNPRKS